MLLETWIAKPYGRKSILRFYLFYPSKFRRSTPSHSLIGQTAIQPSIGRLEVKEYFWEHIGEEEKFWWTIELIWSFIWGKNEAKVEEDRDCSTQGKKERLHEPHKLVRCVGPWPTSVPQPLKPVTNVIFNISMLHYTPPPNSFRSDMHSQCRNNSKHMQPCEHKSKAMNEPNACIWRFICYGVHLARSIMLLWSFYFLSCKINTSSGLLCPLFIFLISETKEIV